MFRDRDRGDPMGVVLGPPPGAWPETEAERAEADLLAQRMRWALGQETQPEWRPPAGGALVGELPVCSACGHRGVDVVQGLDGAACGDGRACCARQEGG